MRKTAKRDSGRSQDSKVDASKIILSHEMAAASAPVTYQPTAVLLTGGAVRVWAWCYSLWLNSRAALSGITWAVLGRQYLLRVCLMFGVSVSMYATRCVGHFSNQLASIVE